MAHFKIFISVSCFSWIAVLRRLISVPPSFGWFILWIENVYGREKWETVWLSFFLSIIHRFKHSSWNGFVHKWCAIYLPKWHGNFPVSRGKLPSSTTTGNGIYIGKKGIFSVCKFLQNFVFLLLSDWGGEVGGCKKRRRKAVCVYDPVTTFWVNIDVDYIWNLCLCHPSSDGVC